MNDLQARINERAEVKLQARIKKLRNNLYDDNDLANFLTGYYAKEGDKAENLRALFFSTSGSFWRTFADKIRPAMQEAETLLFMSEIDSIKQQVEDLFDSRNADWKAPPV